MLTWRWLSPPINFPGSEYMSHVHKDAFNAPCPFISSMTQWITGHSSYRMMMMMAWPWWAKRMTVDLLNSTAKSLGIIISHWCGSEDTLFCTQPHWLGLTANKYMLHVRWLSTFKFSSKVEGKEHLYKATPMLLQSYILQYLTSLGQNHYLRIYYCTLYVALCGEVRVFQFFHSNLYSKQLMWFSEFFESSLEFIWNNKQKSDCFNG